MFGSITFHSNPYFGYNANSFISFSIVCELRCQRCKFYCPLRKLNCLLLLDGTNVQIWQHIYLSKRSNPFSVIILVFLGNT